MKRLHLGTAVAALAAALAGCAVGPDFHKPAPPATDRFLPSGEAMRALGGREEAPAQTFAEGGEIPRAWWELFHSPELDALVREALANNADVKAAEAALQQAHELMRAQRGALWPSIAAQMAATRARNSDTIAPPLSTNATVYSLYTPQVTVSFAPDVFGGIKRQVEAASAKVDAQQAQLDAAHLTLASNVVTAALQIASLREQREAAEAAIEDQRRLLAILQRQQQLGQVSGADVAAQEAALALAEQALPPLAKQEAQQRDLLAALLGRYASAAPVERLRIADLTLPREPPVGVPSELVRRRPDIRVAEANLHAASAEIGVAAAARLPNLVLTADLGSAAQTLSGLGDSANRFWTLTAGLTQPIFEGGALKAQQRAAEAAYRQAAAQYRGAVVLAFQNVADALEALRQDGAALDAAGRAQAAAQRSLAIARRQLEVGQISGVALLNAEQAYEQSRAALIQARTARFTDTAALFQALGAGDWSAPAAHAGG